MKGTEGCGERILFDLPLPGAARFCPLAIILSKLPSYYPDPVCGYDFPEECVYFAVEKFVFVRARSRVADFWTAVIVKRHALGRPKTLGSTLPGRQIGHYGGPGAGVRDPALVLASGGGHLTKKRAKPRGDFVHARATPTGALFRTLENQDILCLRFSGIQKSPLSHTCLR